MNKKTFGITFFAVFLTFTLVLTACAPAVQETAVPESTEPPTPQTPDNTPVPASTATDAPTDPEPTATPDLSSFDISIDGTWKGSLAIAGSSLENIVHFRTADNSLLATLDIPPQNLFGYELAEVSFDGVNVHFEGFAEVNRKAVWDGRLDEDGVIRGTFEQAGYQGTFELFPAGMIASDEPPPPYSVEEVTFENGDITLGGTLTIPEGDGPFPAFVLISGSGAQNRDEEIFGFKIFGKIADHFTRSGIAVLRYDDRGVGASTGDLSESTSAELAGDVSAAVDLLLTRPEIDPDNIGLLGHSEGGIIAPMVANQRDDIAMLILLAGTALPGEEIIYQQIELLSRAEGLSEEEIEEALETQRRYFEALLRDGDWEAIKEELREQITDQVNALPAAQKEAIGNLEDYIDTVYQQQVGTLESAWYLFFLTYDPATALEEITIPVLGIFGGLDLQVPYEMNAPAMEAALERAGNENVTILTYPEANHLFQEANTGSTSEYAYLDKEFAASACGYVPRKNNKRSQSIEWEHVVPAHALGQSRQCWREPICTNSKGKPYKGRQCCEKVDPVFRAMVSDLRNLVPAIGELNGDRSNYTFSMLEGEPRNYGACDFEVDRSLRKVEPRPEVRGDIARTYFYMHETYGLPLSGKQRQLFEVWDREDPLSEWEVLRNARIDSIVQRRWVAMSEGSDYVPSP
ncbi:MAG: alpha/beta fold hydrolase [Marinobacter sp.]|uniref:alpha/beta fold hydrolase n=1 Tax=Marinobacter sp. TaxID=50741 RepID=UPI00396EC6C0